VGERGERVENDHLAGEGGFSDESDYPNQFLTGGATLDEESALPHLLLGVAKMMDKVGR
jgi:hypothetical protein